MGSEEGRRIFKTEQEKRYGIVSGRGLFAKRKGEKRRVINPKRCFKELQPGKKREISQNQLENKILRNLGRITQEMLKRINSKVRGIIDRRSGGRDEEGGGELKAWSGKPTSEYSLEAQAEKTAKGARATFWVCGRIGRRFEAG